MPSIQAIASSFSLLYQFLQHRPFTKSKKMDTWDERDLLPLVRFFLLGKFGHIVQPEYNVQVRIDPPKNGRIDFRIGKVAVEFAVRSKSRSKAKVSAPANSSEVRKLAFYQGKAILVLFDYSDTPYTRGQLREYRKIPNFKSPVGTPSAFNLLYYNLNAKSERPYYSLNIHP